MRGFLALMAATAWISVHEFLRNELLFKAIWVEHFATLGRPFPDAMLNNALWGLWSLVMAGVLAALVPSAGLLRGVLAAWVAGWGLMWIALGNLGVLPLALLPWALPWSLVEAAGAGWLLARLRRP